MRGIVATLGWALALTALGAAAAPAQTRVDVALGFGLPRPYVSGVVVVGPPLRYSAPPEVIVVPAPRAYYYRRPLFEERRGYWGYWRYRGYRGYRRGWGGRQHRRHWEEDDDD
jgi:hypothetical protein